MGVQRLCYMHTSLSMLLLLPKGVRWMYIVVIVTDVVTIADVAVTSW